MARQRVHAKTPVAQPPQIVPVGVGHRFARFTLRIGEQRQRPFCSDAWIELPKAARGGVARIGEYLLPSGGLGFIHLEEVGLGHEDLAANFDQRRRTAFQPCRYRIHRAQIGGDILTLGAVAARRTTHEATVLVGQVDRQAIDLRFGDKCQLGARRQPDKASRAGTELAEFFHAHCIVERQHRHAMAAPLRTRSPARRRRGWMASPRGSDVESGPRSRHCAGAARRTPRR